MILLRFSAPIKVYYLSYTIIDRKEEVHYLTKFLNSLNPLGTPFFSYNIIVELRSTKIIQRYKIANKIFQKLFTLMYFYWC